MYPVLSDKVVSYGGCQFPTLGFVVDRYASLTSTVLLLLTLLLPLFLVAATIAVSLNYVRLMLQFGYCCCECRCRFAAAAAAAACCPGLFLFLVCSLCQESMSCFSLSNFNFDSSDPFLPWHPCFPFVALFVVQEQAIVFHS
jgi:hypothetical protein